MDLSIVPPQILFIGSACGGLDSGIMRSYLGFAYGGVSGHSALLHLGFDYGVVIAELCSPGFCLWGRYRGIMHSCLGFAYGGVIGEFCTPAWALLVGVLSGKLCIPRFCFWGDYPGTGHSFCWVLLMGDLLLMALCTPVSVFENGAMSGNYALLGFAYIGAVGALGTCVRVVLRGGFWFLSSCGLPYAYAFSQYDADLILDVTSPTYTQTLGRHRKWNPQASTIHTTLWRFKLSAYSPYICYSCSHVCSP